jgi:hypothetical protein
MCNCFFFASNLLARKATYEGGKKKIIGNQLWLFHWSFNGNIIMRFVVVGNHILTPFDLLCFLCFINQWNLRVPVF